MKKLVLFCFCLSTLTSIAQKQTYGLVSYIPPAGWKKEAKTNMTAYTMTDNKKNSWCQIFIVKSTTSKGSAEADFESEWQELVVKNYRPSGAPQSEEVKELDGWKIKMSAGKFVFNKSDAAVLLTTASGYGRCMSIVAIMNSEDYSAAITKFLESVEMVRPSTEMSSTETNTIPADNSFAFNTTNFDDGWKSTVQEDWVEVTKGSIRVLLHYPKEGTIFPADPAPLTNAAWNILVAPRCSNVKNYKTADITTYNRPYLGMGYATENATGRNVFIVFFRQGSSGWLEFIAPDKNSFMQQYKFDPETIQWDSNSDLMIPLANMTAYNKFAVAASDLKGKWTSDFTGIQQLYNVYTGQYAGMNVNQSNEEFVFSIGNSYNWKLLVVNGMGGNAKFTEIKSAGQFTVPNNWQISFTMIENRARGYHAFWSCIKGARVLNLLPIETPGSGIYTKYGLAK
ncbi:MAG: hypothetical protein BGO55_16315 [Sphingobacteriales bacterium 50-39]|nr:hypothetical protein [Sphingobacteriales bacterium]OJW56561.1 MAG: hypothetical protein BGO55_16315 [Sphingobacteriales bacterium 50-39]